MGLRRIGMTWGPTDINGWGVFGLNLALNLIRNGPTTPMLFAEPKLQGAPADTLAALAPFTEECSRIAATLLSTEGLAVFDDATLIHSLSDSFHHDPISDQVRGRHNVGFVFFENAALDADALERARRWDRLLVGSSWNRDVCQAAGLDDVQFVSQGIDTDHFRPPPPSAAPRQRFVIFSGGKFELRKGQYIVLAAFRQFHERHPDSLLITAWQNLWPQSAASIMESPHVTSLPQLDADGKLAIVDWALVHGLQSQSIIDTGWIPNVMLPTLLSKADVALFPNRAEGGTNLAAMEVMACGVPCILSANTGHLDLIGEGNCYVLEDQKPCTYSGDPAGHWRESSIDNILQQLETAYQDAADRRQRGERGAEFMRHLSWKNQVAKIVTAIEDFL
jgi:glycosyltransferase involved in cell wall biosynthesis